MIKLLATTALGALCLSAALQPAKAGDYVSGNWAAYAQTFAGTSSPGCGMRSGPVAKQVHVKWFPGRDGLSVQIFKQGWRIPKGTKLTVHIGFDKSILGTAEEASGAMMDYSNGGAIGVVSFHMTDPTLLDNFLNGFRDAERMWITFPGGTEAPWWLDMTGSGDVLKAFYRCITANDKNNSQPFGKPPETSQPFGKTSPQPAAKPYNPADRGA